MARPFGILLGALAGLSCAAMLDGSRALVKLKENVVLTTLDNGLRVVIVEDRSSPVVALNIWVQTGSADETDDESGMAHVFEHMLFKGTERRAVGEIAQTVEGAGGNINAFTSFDMTVYHITMASRDAGVGIDVLSDAVLNSTFDPDELAKETEVVVEEIRRGEDSPSRVLFNALFSSAYTRHPYGRPVIGTTERVRSFTRPGLLDFHARWYVPNNMTFVVVGDQDPQVTLEQIR
ncbi:MAG: pitrilysin family protein, partial [Myxococcota bacterium]